MEEIENEIIDCIKRDAAKRIRQSKASKENGKLGGRPPKAKKGDKPIESQSVFDNQFQSFWDSYNKKTSKPDAEKKFKAALKNDTFENIMAGVGRYIKTRGDDSKFWKNPSTWLNQECWKDEYNSTQNNFKSTSASRDDEERAKIAAYYAKLEQNNN